MILPRVVHIDQDRLSRYNETMCVQSTVTAGLISGFQK